MQLPVYSSALWDSMQSWVMLASLSFIENLPHLKIITRWHSQSGSHVINFSCLQIIVLDHVLKWRDGVGGPWKCLDLSREAGQPTQMGLLQLLAEIKWTSPYFGKGGPDSQCYFMLTFFECPACFFLPSRTDCFPLPLSDCLAGLLCSFQPSETPALSGRKSI